MFNIVCKIDPICLPRPNRKGANCHQLFATNSDFDAFLQQVTFPFLYNFRSVFDDFVFLLLHGFLLLFFQNYDLHCVWLLVIIFAVILSPRALGPRALGPRPQGPWAHGTWAHGTWAHGPWAHGPRALWRRAERRQFSESSHPPSQPAPRGRDKPVVETPHWDIQPPLKGYQ